MSAPPGPWFAAPYSSVVGLGIVGPGGRVIASVAIAPGFNPSAPHESKRDIEYADEVRNIANMLAAAPELYEKGTRLSMLVDRLLSADPQEQPTPDMLDEAQRDFATALQKAAGQ